MRSLELSIWCIRLAITVAVLTGASEFAQAQAPVPGAPPANGAAAAPFEMLYSECVADPADSGFPSQVNWEAPPVDGLFSSVYFNDIIGENWRWTFLPQGFLYHTYWASVAEPRLSVQTVHDYGGSNNWLDSHIAGRFGIVRFGERYAEEGFQVDLLAGVNLRQNLDTPQWDMTGTDYRYDIPLTYRRGAHAWKFGFYHVSSHMGDEFLEKNPTVTRIDYFRDSLYLGYSYYATPELRLYGEIDYAFSRDYAGPWHFQFGFDWGPVQPTRIYGAPFVAMNAHLREELDFGGSFSMQAGWAWRGEGLGAGTLRTGLFFYNGGSPQFSFYEQSEQQLGWGLWYDY